MKKIFLALILLNLLTTPTTQAVPNIFHSIHEKYTENTYTSKVISGTCFILAGLVTAFKMGQLPKELKMKPLVALPSVGLILTGGALWRSAYLEVYQPNVTFIKANKPLYYCNKCNKNVRSNSQAEQIVCSDCNNTQIIQIPLPERKSFKEIQII